MAAPQSGRPSRRFYILLSLLVVLTVMLGAAIAATANSRTASSSADSYHQRRLILNTDVNPYGANVFLTQEVEDWKVEKTIRTAQEAGLGWLKQQFSWEEIEPEKGVFLVPGTSTSSWAKYDRMVDLAEKHGLQIIARLDRPPAWAKPAANSGRGPIDNYNDYGDFVNMVVKRYAGRVRYIQIWNEPNLYYEWGGLEPSARDYVTLLRLAYKRAKEADPNVVVLSAPLAPTLERSVRAMSDLDYLQQMYDAGARNYFDILSVNAFGQDRPPEDPPDANVLNFQRVVLQRQIMERNGDTARPIWINEFGWNAAPADFAPELLIWQRVTEQQQADYTVRGIKLARTQWDWAGVICIWYLRQAGNIRPDVAEYYFRMVDADFTPRLVYRLVKAEATLPGPEAGYFEESNPGLQAGAGWLAQLASPAGGGQHLVSEQPGTQITITFQGNSLDIVALRAPDAGQIAVTIDGQPANALPRDKSKRAYLDLASPTSRWQVQTQVAHDLRSGQHTAVLTHLPGTGPVNVDAYLVGRSTATRPVFVFGVLALVFAADIVLLWRETKKRTRA